MEAANAADTKLLWLDIHGDLSAETEAELSRILAWRPIVLENFHLASSRPKLINFDHYSQLTLYALNLSIPKEEGRLSVEPDELMYHVLSHPTDKYVPAIEYKKDLIAAMIGYFKLKSWF